MNYTRAVSVSRFILVILCIALVLSIALCGIDSWGLGGIFEPGTIRLGLDLSAVRSSPTAPIPRTPAKRCKRA